MSKNNLTKSWSGCFFSSEKYGRGKLSYGIARPHSLETNSPIGKISKGNYAREIPSEFLWIERALSVADTDVTKH
jgi:hypothetical protein